MYVLLNKSETRTLTFYNAIEDPSTNAQLHEAEMEPGPGAGPYSSGVKPVCPPPPVCLQSSEPRGMSGRQGSRDRVRRACLGHPDGRSLSDPSPDGRHSGPVCAEGTMPPHPLPCDAVTPTWTAGRDFLGRLPLSPGSMYLHC